MSSEELKIVVTGGSGFIGTNFIEYCVNKGHSVYNIDIKEPMNKTHLQYWIKVDINDFDSLNSELCKIQPDFIVHLAARTDLNGKTLDEYKTNTEGLLNLINVCNMLDNLKRVVFASSKLVCRNGYKPVNNTDYAPDTLYGESKAKGESIIYDKNSEKFSWVIIRPTSIWGPWFGEPYKDFFFKVKKRMYVHPKGADIKKTYGFVGNTVFQLYKILFAQNELVNKKTFYLGDYEPIKIKEWADIISNEFGVSKSIEVPLVMLRMLAKAGDLMKIIGFKRFPYSTFRLNNILADTTFDFSNLKCVCGELPYSLEEGVKITVKWMKEYC